VLIGFLKLVSPITPFITDDIYTKLTNEDSIHLTDFPVCDETKINERIEKRMDLVKDLISLGRNAREEAKIKVRQPISEVIIDAKNEKIIGDMTNLVCEELNVKNVIFENDLSKYMNFIVKPNFKEVGKILGSKIKMFQEVLTKLTIDEINSLRNELEVVVNLDSEEFTVNNSMVDIRVESKEGFNSTYSGNNFIVLNTTLTKELINEGLARETVSKIQQIRKNNGFDVADRVKVYYESDDAYTEDLTDFVEFVKDETLALEFIKTTGLDELYDVNDYKVGFKVEKM
jgi:isoleucyl-tRNA synthetase